MIPTAGRGEPSGDAPNDGTAQAPSRHPSLRAGMQVSVRAAAAAAIAVGLAELLRLRFPLYAMVGAVIVLERSPKETRRLARTRMIGTLIGAAVGAALSSLLNDRALAIFVGVACAMLVSHAFGLASAARVSGYVCGIVLLEHQDQPVVYAAYRLVETFIGIGAAILVSWVPKLIRAESHAVDDVAGD